MWRITPREPGKKFVPDGIWKRIREFEKSGAGILDIRRSIDLVSLISMRLARGRQQDLADVIVLIRHDNLDESFAEHLDSALRDDYIHCLDERRIEEENDARLFGEACESAIPNPTP